MACELVLQPLGGGDSGGQWFLTNPGGSPKYLGVSLTPGGPYSYGTFNAGDPLSPAGNDTLYIDVSGIPYMFDVLIQFTYVVGGGVPANCGDACVDCAVMGVQIRAVPPEPSDQEFCVTDTATYNLFVLAGLACTNYQLAYTSGSPEDADFELGSTCAGTKGDFSPQNITPGVYSFDFTRNGSQPGCTDCTVNMQVTITEEPDPGLDTVGVVCI